MLKFRVFLLRIFAYVRDPCKIKTDFLFSDYNIADKVTAESEGASSTQTTEKEGSETDEEFRSLEKNAKGKKKKAKNSKITFQEQMINLQREQMEQQKVEEKNHRELVLKMFEQQRKSDAEERERDREFFLQLGSMLAGNNNNSNK